MRIGEYDGIYDAIDALFEAMDEGELLGDDLGESLVIVSSAMPRGGGVVGGETEATPSSETGELSAVEMEDMTATASTDWGEALVPWAGGELSSLARGRRVAQMAEGGSDSSGLIQRMVELARGAGIAQSLVQGGHGGGGSPTGGGVAVEAAATAFSVASATRRQSVATVETARTVDRAIERDARRYDGGFLLG